MFPRLPGAGFAVPASRLACLLRILFVSSLYLPPKEDTGQHFLLQPFQRTGCLAPSLSLQPCSRATTWVLRGTFRHLGGLALLRVSLQGNFCLFFVKIFPVLFEPVTAFGHRVNGTIILPGLTQAGKCVASSGPWPLSSLYTSL